MFTYWSEPLMQIITAIITLVIPAFGARSWFFSIDPAAESPVRLFLFGGGIYISMVGMIRTISMPSETAPSPDLSIAILKLLKRENNAHDLENNNALLGVWTDKLNMTVDAILNWEKLVFMI